MRFLVLALVVALAGCAGTASTIDGSADQRLYAITAEQADQVLLSAIRDEFPSYEVTPVYPDKAYKVRFTFMLDFQNIIARAIPVKAVGPDGRPQTKYGFEVSNSGSSVVQGKIYANNLFHTIKRLAVQAEMAPEAPNSHMLGRVGFK